MNINISNRRIWSILFVVIGLGFNCICPVEKNAIVAYDEYLQKIYNSTITSKELTCFAHQLLQNRIDHWQQVLGEAQENNDIEQVFSKIPLYIQLKSDITPEEMLFECSFDENMIDAGLTSYDEKDRLIIVLKKKLCKSMIYLLYILQHELVHIEQAANAWVVKNILKNKLSDKSGFFTNQEAFQIYKNIFENKSIETKHNSIKSESEADKGGIEFTVNVFALNNDVICNKKNWHFSRELTKDGYLSFSQMKKCLNKKIDICYKNNAEKLERHKKEYEKWNTLYQNNKKKKKRIIPLNVSFDEKELAMLLLNLNDFNKNSN